MIYCQHCGTKNPNEAKECQSCHEPLSDKLVTENERPLVQKLHQAENVSREKNDSAMSFIVLGSIFLILGIIFFVLSFKLPNATALTKKLITTCFEFWVAMAGLFGGGGCLIYGLVKLIINLTKLKELAVDIAYIREHKTPIVPDKK